MNLAKNALSACLLLSAIALGSAKTKKGHVLRGMDKSEEQLFEEIKLEEKIVKGLKQGKITKIAEETLEESAEETFEIANNSTYTATEFMGGEMKTLKNKSAKHSKGGSSKGGSSKGGYEPEEPECDLTDFPVEFREVGDDSEVDLDGDGKNDFVRFYNDLMLKDEDSTKIGYSYGTCNIFMLESGKVYYCAMTFMSDGSVLPEGQISLQGDFSNMVITGGAGCYQGATGTVKGRELEGSGTIDATFDYALDITT